MSPPFFIRERGKGGTKKVVSSCFAIVERILYEISVFLLAGCVFGWKIAVRAEGLNTSHVVWPSCLCFVASLKKEVQVGQAASLWNTRCERTHMRGIRATKAMQNKERGRQPLGVRDAH